MALTQRKKRPVDRTGGHPRDARLIIIATEGADTEGQYFSIFRNTRVHIKVLPSPKDEEDPEHGHSSPNAVLKRLRQYKGEFQLDEKLDELWLVVDVDNWPTSQLAAVAGLCEQAGFGLAISNPCFELWLYLHHSDIDATKQHTAQTLTEGLRRLLGGYNKSKLRSEDFRDYVDDAITRAKRLNTDSEERWPSTLGTHVYRVVESIRR